MITRVKPDESRRIDIFYEGDENVTEVCFENPDKDLKWVLNYFRRGDKRPYSVPLQEEEDNLIWTITLADTAKPGMGIAQLVGSGKDQTKHSGSYSVFVRKSLVNPGDVPAVDKAFLDKVAKEAAEAQTAAENTKTLYNRIQAGLQDGSFRGEKGEKGERGEQGPTGPQGPQGEAGPAGDTTAADAAAEAAKKAAQKAAESVGGLADDLATLKTENTALKAETARTARSLDYLWKKSKGIIYDTETVTGAGSRVTVPSGAMDYAALRMVGGMSQRDADNNVLIDAQVDEVRVRGKNLVNVDAAEIQGVSNVSIAGDDIIVKNFSFVKFPLTLAVGDVVSVSFGVAADFSNAEIGFLLDDGEKIILWGVYTGAVEDSKKTISRTISKNVVAIYIRSWDKANNVKVSDLQVELFDTPTAYSPYRLETYPIPQAIRDMCPDYGQGTVDSYNYIDFTGKSYHHVGSMSQDGTWTALVAPEIIDLSAVWPDDDFGVLRVEAGGTINLHYPALDDGFELAVPSETEIMVDVAKVVGTNG